MKKRTKRFDDGGMASSGPQYAFTQARGSMPTERTSIFQATPDTGTGIGGVASLGQQQMQQEPPMQQMRRGGKVKTKAYAAGGAVKKTRGDGAVKKTRGDGCCQKGKTRGAMR